MITEKMKDLVAKSLFAYVASADASGLPHLAAGAELSVPDEHHLLFSAWFCPTTLRNLHDNPRICVAVTDPGTGDGFQFEGRVEKVEDEAILDGYFPEQDLPETPQVESRLSVLVEKVMAFAITAHTDRPLG